MREVIDVAPCHHDLKPAAEAANSPKFRLGIPRNLLAADGMQHAGDATIALAWRYRADLHSVVVHESESDIV